MKINVEAILESVVEGQVMHPGPGRAITPLTIKVALNVFNLDFIEIKGYKDEQNGKITYSQPIIDSRLDKCLEKQKVGDKIPVSIISFENKLIKYTRR